MPGNNTFVWGEKVLKEFIDRTTTYRLMLYYLLVLFVAALCFGAIGVLPYSPIALLWSAGVLITVSWAANTFFAWIFRAVTNAESIYITAFILTLIMPSIMPVDVVGTAGLAAIALLAVIPKYLIAPWKKHVFNPAAFAAMLSTFIFGVSASWWVAGNTALLPFVVIGGGIGVF